MQQSLLQGDDSNEGLSGLLSTTNDLHEDFLAQAWIDADLISNGIPFSDGTRFSDGAGFALEMRPWMNGPYWEAHEKADHIQLMRERCAEIGQDQTGSWRFWGKWLTVLFENTAMSNELIVAIRDIDDTIWESGPEAVAAEIERIQAEHFAARNPLAETVNLNPNTQRFYTTPVPVQNQTLISALLSRVKDSVEDATLGNNGLNATSREVRVLNRAVDRYANDPQRIEMDFTSVAVGLRRQIHDTRELPNSEDNLALLEAVEDGVRGLRAAHSDVAENRRLLAEQKLKELSSEDIALLEDAKPVLMAISEGQMAQDFAQDIPELINDALTPLPSGAPPLPGADPATRVFNRVSKMRLMMDSATERGAKTFDSKGMKTARLGLTVGGVFSALIGLALRLFGVM